LINVETEESILLKNSMIYDHCVCLSSALT